MKLTSSKIQSNHLLIALMNYIVDCDDNDSNKYGFAYVNIHPLIETIKSMRQNWNEEIVNACLKFDEELILISADIIETRTHDNESGYEHIKLDSLSYLESEPFVGNTPIISLVGGVYCYRDWFVVQCEQIPEGLNYSTVIYRSPRMFYEKIGV